MAVNDLIQTAIIALAAAISLAATLPDSGGQDLRSPLLDAAVPAFLACFTFFLGLVALYLGAAAGSGGELPSPVSAAAAQRLASVTLTVSLAGVFVSTVLSAGAAPIRSYSRIHTAIKAEFLAVPVAILAGPAGGLALATLPLFAVFTDRLLGLCSRMWGMISAAALDLGRQLDLLVRSPIHLFILLAIPVAALAVSDLIIGGGQLLHAVLPVNHGTHLVDFSSKACLLLSFGTLLMGFLLMYLSIYASAGLPGLPWPPAVASRYLMSVTTAVSAAAIFVSSSLMILQLSLH